MATPIGNARDITLRALDTLAGADLLYAEDTRVTAKLLALHGISRALRSYREHNAARAEGEILAALAAGKSVALASDAGTPLVSDPGDRLVKAVIDAGLPVTAVPGASAVLTALTLSGLPSDRFLFAGFLPHKAGDRRRAIAELAAVPATLVVFESPNRLPAALADLSTVLGARHAVVARELTKLHEELRRGPLSELAQHYETVGPPKGEVVILIAPPDAQVAAPEGQDLDRRIAAELARYPVKEAAAIIAGQLGLPRRVVYARALEIKAELAKSTAHDQDT